MEEKLKKDRRLRSRVASAGLTMIASTVLPLAAQDAATRHVDFADEARLEHVLFQGSMKRAGRGRTWFLQTGVNGRASSGQVIVPLMLEGKFRTLTLQARVLAMNPFGDSRASVACGFSPNQVEYTSVFKITSPKGKAKTEAFVFEEKVQGRDRLYVKVVLEAGWYGNFAGMDFIRLRARPADPNAPEPERALQPDLALSRRTEREPGPICRRHWSRASGSWLCWTLAPRSSAVAGWQVPFRRRFGSATRGAQLLRARSARWAICCRQGPCWESGARERVQRREFSQSGDA